MDKVANERLNHYLNLLFPNMYLTQNQLEIINKVMRTYFDKLRKIASDYINDKV